MNTQDQKIWHYVLNNPFIAKNLFFYDYDRNDLDAIYFGEAKDYSSDKKEDFINTTWLYPLHFEFGYFIAIGLHLDGWVMSFGNEGEFNFFSNSLCNLPYDLLDLGCAYLSDGSYLTNQFFKENPQFKEALDVYESWCQSEGITLDEKHEFHNENGELLEQLGTW